MFHTTLMCDRSTCRSTNKITLQKQLYSSIVVLLNPFISCSELSQVQPNTRPVREFFSASTAGTAQHTYAWSTLSNVDSSGPLTFPPASPRGVHLGF